MRGHSFILTGFLSIFYLNSFCQINSRLDSLLSKKFFFNSANNGGWVYNSEASQLEKINAPEIERVIPEFVFYKATLTNYLGYHINKSTCLILFNSPKSEVLLIMPMWYSDISVDFLKLFIGKKFNSNDELISFNVQLQKLLAIGSNGSFENTVYKKDKITCDYSIIQNGKKITWRKIEVSILDNRIQDFTSTNPILKEVITIKK